MPAALPDQRGVTFLQCSSLDASLCVVLHAGLYVLPGVYTIFLISLASLIQASFTLSGAHESTPTV